MKTFLGFCLVAAAWMSTPSLADDAQGDGCSKNHFILSDPAGCWQEAAPLHVPRAGHTATLLRDGRVLVVGGDGAKSAEIYDPSTASWTLAAPLHVARSGHTATLLADGRVLVLGGHTTYAPPAYVFVIDPTGEIYDPASDTWQSIDGPLTPRIAFTATLLPGGKVLVAGGVDVWDDTVAGCELYDPATGRWTETGAFAARWGHTATALADGRVLVAGGYEDDMIMLPETYAQVYDPATAAWTLAGRTARGNHAASLLADGRVMVTGGLLRDCCARGGYYRASAIADSGIYDPVTNTWSLGPELGTARLDHTATVLGDGSLLVVGGTATTGQIPQLGTVLLASVESSAGPGAPFWACAALTTARYDHTATRLGDGSVLVVGGLGSVDGTPLRSAVVYRPPRSAP